MLEEAASVLGALQYGCCVKRFGVAVARSTSGGTANGTAPSALPRSPLDVQSRYIRQGSETWRRAHAGRVTTGGLLGALGWRHEKAAARINLQRNM
ncbi:hypothetical protein MNEG_15608, partial [Monoraphidium neglectum]